MSVRWRVNEALDQTLRDLRSNQIFFAGGMILLAGNFRQTLAVIPRPTADNGINACLKVSILLRYVKNLKLTTNMRVALQNDISAEVFSKALLDIGNGRVHVSTKFLSIYAKKGIILKVFPNINAIYKSHFSGEK